MKTVQIVMNQSHRYARLADFAARKSFSPQSVIEHQLSGWSYIPVHHFAGEGSDAGAIVDCWCLLGEDAALLECETCTQAARPAELWVCIDDKPPYWPKLHVTFTALPITRQMAEDVMTRFVELGFPDLGVFETIKPGERIRLNG